MPLYISDSGFMQVKEIDFINTGIGSYSYYNAIK